MKLECPSPMKGYMGLLSCEFEMAIGPGGRSEIEGKATA